MSAGFPDTHWSRLEGLHSASDAERHEALRWFAREYWKPVHQYVRALRHDSRDVEDLTQQFFTTLLDRHDIETLAPARGSVRAYLKAAIRNFLFKTTRAARGHPQLLSLEVQENEIAADSALPPDDAFDRAWIRHVLEAALAHLRRELEAAGHQTEFAIFEAYCLQDDEGATYQQIGERFGIKAEDARNRVRDARRRMMVIVRALVAEYVGREQEIDDEVAFIVGASESR